MAKVKFVHVPYKGGGAASVDLIGPGPRADQVTYRGATYDLAEDEGIRRFGRALGLADDRAEAFLAAMGTVGLDLSIARMTANDVTGITPLAFGVWYLGAHARSEGIYFSQLWRHPA